MIIVYTVATLCYNWLIDILQISVANKPHAARHGRGVAEGAGTQRGSHIEAGDLERNWSVLVWEKNMKHMETCWFNMV